MSVYYMHNATAVPPNHAQARAFHLSPRQIDVLRLLGDGLSNKQIGRALGISYQTVKQHIQCVLEELGAANRLQAVVFAYRRGILAFDAAETSSGGGGVGIQAGAPFNVLPALHSRN